MTCKIVIFSSAYRHSTSHLYKFCITFFKMSWESAKRKYSIKKPPTNCSVFSQLCRNCDVKPAATNFPVCMVCYKILEDKFPKICNRKIFDELDKLEPRFVKLHQSKLSCRHKKGATYGRSRGQSPRIDSYTCYSPGFRKVATNAIPNEFKRQISSSLKERLANLANERKEKISSSLKERLASLNTSYNYDNARQPSVRITHYAYPTLKQVYKNSPSSSRWNRTACCPKKSLNKTF